MQDNSNPTNNQTVITPKPLQLGYGHPKIFDTPRAIYRIGTLPILELAIKSTHKRFNNATTDGKIVVVGNGASQLLVAAIHCLNNPFVFAEVPYFARFPEYAKYAGKTWNTEQKGIQIITTPSNPLNKQEYTKVGDEVIFDMCYNWPTFVDNPLNLDEDLMIFSMSKCTGDAALRVGWALVKDPVLAVNMINYIEMTTGGVSLDQQEIAATILGNLLPQDLLDMQRKLKNRWDQILALEPKLPFIILNRSGQFMLIEGQIHPSVITIPGKMMGYPEESGMNRVNLGCSEDEFQKFMDVLNELSRQN